MTHSRDAISFALGSVRHRRFYPKAHAFCYSVAYVVVDAACIDNTNSATKSLLAINRWGVVSINRADLITPINRSIVDAVGLRLAQAGVRMQPSWRVDVLTLPRFMGYTFNPVSFYTVYNHADHIVAILSDITNTPWGERHTYVHIAQQIKALDTLGNTYQFSLAKDFHVSPFMPMRMAYDWRFNFSQDKQIIHMRLLENCAPDSAEQINNLNQSDSATRLTFDATFSFHKKPFHRWTAWYLTLSYPLLPFRIVAQIYWQALRLWLKGVPFNRHPNKAVASKPPA